MLAASVTSPQGMAECEPEVKVATGQSLYIQNKKKNNNFLWGEVTSSAELAFHISNLPRDGRGCSGKWLFELMWAHFQTAGTAIHAIQGNFQGIPLSVPPRNGS